MDKSYKFFLINEDVCVRLLLSGEDIKELLRVNNWEETVSMDEADIILINTCAFMKQAEDKSVNRIKKITHFKGAHQEVVVFGCLPDINPDRLSQINTGGRFFSGRNLAEAIKMFNLRDVPRKIGHKIKRDGSIGARILRLVNRLFWHDDYFTYLYDKEKVFHLKIAEGCLGICSYCAERLARKSLVSKPIEEIMREFQCGLAEGYRIFSLNADDVGMFGQDRGENIADLLENILAIEKDFKIVLTEFNPAAFVKYKDKLLKALSSPKIIFITIPIESGSQKIIHLMQRQYSLEKVVPILQQLKKINPQMKINTHIIVGFPGETDDDFRATLQLCGNFYFNKIKIFPYNERPNTVAMFLDGKVPIEERIERKNELARKIFWMALQRLDIKAILLNNIKV